MSIKYPDIEVELSGLDVNGFLIIAKVSRELKKSGVDESEIREFKDEAKRGDYDNLLSTCMEWVSVY